METKIEFIPYPTFEEVFTETDELGKYVFFPLLSIHFSNHSELNDKSFHVISLWDTGNYGSCHFGKYRIDNYNIQFDLVGNKISYKDRIEFPFIELLPKAYQIIYDYFEKNKKLILANSEGLNLGRNQLKMGKELVLKEIPEFGNFEAGFYFEKVTSYFLARYKLERGIKVYPETQDSWMGEKSISVFMQSFLSNPTWLQGAAHPENSRFIGQLYESNYLSDASADVYLFYDESINRQIQISQWS